MSRKKGYEVLKLAARGGRCYVSADYVYGTSLAGWLKYHTVVSKEQMFRWMLEMTWNLALFHQCGGNPSYQYVNPYSVVAAEDGKLYFMDLGSGRQEELLHKMQHRSIRENFLSPGNQYYQKASVDEDIYGLGRTVQFFLASVDVEPLLSRREESKFRKIIAKCLEQNPRKKYQTVREIAVSLSKIKNK